ncbi:MAG: transcriptional regulator [Actinobacteria bacterium HGW-Actinobacteria-5]|jgi:DeoR/GlpR family transcriptional regulator of sugar metabolism|nr:MAG: transcriptional regulator [Actinobacteria bacterium HGW-Actinobacteria-5]
MPKESLYPARRRAEMQEFLRDRGQASIHELATEFGVSEDTVRRDVETLASQGSVERTHGGVTISPDDRFNGVVPFVRRIDAQAAAKDEIARVAASLIDEGQSMIIYGGTTTLALAKYLAPKRGITVVTNNLALPQELYSRGVREIYVLGGSYRLRSQVTIGPVALSDGTGKPRSIHARWAIIGVGGVSEEGTVWTSSLPEAGMMREMMDCATRTLLLADSTKFGKREFAEVADLTANTTLITEKRPSQALLDRAAEVGARVIVTSEYEESGADA